MLKKILSTVAVVAITSLTGSAMATPASAADAHTGLAIQQLQGWTSGQSNAVRMASQYIRTMPFSRSGLIQQLRYEGFSKRNAIFGVDHITVSWKKQAFKMAVQYLKTMPFSHSGLVEQLRYEGFTARQAQYGANRAL
jgi:hypothetical protein